MPNHQSNQRIERIKGTIASHSGFSNPNRFEVIVTPPPFMLRENPNMEREIPVLCDSIDIPGQQLQTVEHYVSAKAIKKPTNYINDDILMNFNITNDFYPWDFFDRWIKGIIHRDTPTHKFGVRYRSEYTSIIDIYTIGYNRDAHSRHIQLYNVFPVTLGNISLGNQNENAVAQIPVSFAYDDWFDRDAPRVGESSGQPDGVTNERGGGRLDPDPRQFSSLPAVAGLPTAEIRARLSTASSVVASEVDRSRAIRDRVQSFSGNPPARNIDDNNRR